MKPFSRWTNVVFAALFAVCGALSPAIAGTPARGERPLIRDAFTDASPEVLEFHQHVVTLADPFFEGRSADARGNRLAAEFVEFYFRQVGLEPAFADIPRAEPATNGAAERRGIGATEAQLAGETPYLQPFSVPGEVEVRTAEARIDSDGDFMILQAGEDFNPMGFSGKGEATGSLVFVGYSLSEGESGYASYNKGDDLTGKIAVLFRYEPVNEKGESAWSNFTGWSRHAELMPKVGDAIARGAVGVIILNPPGVKDPRARVLEAPKATRFGKPVTVPAVMMSPEKAKWFARLATKDAPGPLAGLDLMDLRRLADKGGHGALAFDPGVTVSLNIDVERTRMATNNIGGILRGMGALANEYIIIGAHYDHVGYGYVGGSNPANQGKLHPGADDNASGTVGLIMSARALAERYAELPEGAAARSILFLAFSAEEMGLLGSEHFIKNTGIDSRNVYAMLNMDMIGRMQGDKIEISGMATAEEFPALLAPAFERSGLEVKQVKSGIGPSDHATFHKAGAPVLAFFTGLHADYHTPGDMAHKVNFEGGVRAIHLITDVALALAQRAEALTFKQTGAEASASPARGKARVRLGVMPADYSGEEPGVMVGDVMPGTAAEKAGVKKGDRIIRWGGEELSGPGAMMQRLVDHKPGDVVELVVVRDGKEVTIPVTLVGRGGTE